MRLLHSETLRIVTTVCKDEDFNNATVTRKTVISHAWSEVLKHLATKQAHPKIFIDNSFYLGVYMSFVKLCGDMSGCNLNPEHLNKYPEVYEGFSSSDYNGGNLHNLQDKYFDDNYLFSDATSLYLKGLNIFPYVFGDEWRKYVPIENLNEIQRVVTKTIDKRNKKA